MRHTSVERSGDASAGERIAVVVPTFNEAARIGACLDAVLAQGEAVEIVVVDGGSTDDTVSRAAPPARVVRSVRGRGPQMNAGARAVSADILLFLHADSLLPVGALAAIREALRDPAVAGGTFRLCFDRGAPLLRLYAWFTRFRCRLFHYGDQGIFVRRTAFECVGGFPEWPLMEDLEFLTRLRAAGRIALLPVAVTTSARRFVSRGIVRQQLLNIALLSLYFAGVSPARLARWYEPVAR